MADRMTAQAFRPGQTGNPSDGSRTITIHDVPTREGGGDKVQGSGSGSGGRGGSSGGDNNNNQHNHNGVLRLRGGGNTRRVVWSEETVDNEGMGKKKSKICCIYHKPKAFDESSDESSSCDSVSDSDSGESVASETSTSSRASNSSGVNASKQLRDKVEGKKKKKSGGHKCRDDGHNHGRGESGSRKQKRSGGTVTIVETQASASSSRPAPNAYERGFT